jgi:4-methyl-5(b-hydroxyethyl)-thiazole monophosphate biosynthesis
MKRVLIPLAQGCEELEAVTLIDLLRRAKISVVTAGLDAALVTASRGTVLKPDTDLSQALQSDYDMIILPGGLPGADHLKNDTRLIKALQQQYQQGKKVAAICAAPKVLAHAGLLAGKKATSFPGSLSAKDLEGVDYRQEPVVKDGNILTSRGPGTAMDFALTIIEELCGKTVRDEVEAPLQRPA